MPVKRRRRRLSLVRTARPADSRRPSPSSFTDAPCGLQLRITDGSPRRPTMPAASPQAAPCCRSLPGVLSATALTAALPLAPRLVTVELDADRCSPDSSRLSPHLHRPGAYDCSPAPLPQQHRHEDQQPLNHRTGLNSNGRVASPAFRPFPISISPERPPHPSNTFARRRTSLERLRNAQTFYFGERGRRIKVIPGITRNRNLEHGQIEEETRA